MRFMMFVKHAENSVRPPQELIDAINILCEEDTKAGRMLGGGGLAPISESKRVRLSGGQIKVVDGPFTESKEIIGGFAQFELKSKEDALQGAIHFMELHKKYWPEWEGETEIRQIFGPEDFQQCAKELAGSASRS
ncbi:MAG TPA: YciI family protein [Candidatus Sulfotelmatobacter sp.]